VNSEVRGWNFAGLSFGSKLRRSLKVQAEIFVSRRMARVSDTTGSSPVGNLERQTASAPDKGQAEAGQDDRDSEGFRRITLSPEEKSRVDASAVRGLIRAVVAQGVMALVAAIVAWAVAGSAAGLSALAGAGAYFIPNTLFALRLIFACLSGRGANPITFILGEMLKLLATVLLLWLLTRAGHGWLSWPALLWGLVLTMKGYVLLLMFRKL
jgi:ATP synthase protein I